MEILIFLIGVLIISGLIGWLVYYFIGSNEITNSTFNSETNTVLQSETTNTVEDKSSEYTLDKNGSYTFTQFIEAPGRTKFQIFATLHYYLAKTFDEGYSIRLSDKDEGCIIAVLSFDDIASHTGGANEYTISIRPLFRADIKDEKCRISCSLFAYTVMKIQGGGLIKHLNKLSNDNRINQEVTVEHWPLNETYPFTENDEHGAKKTSLKAAEATQGYFQLMSESIGSAIRDGMIGEDLDW